MRKIFKKQLLSILGLILCFFGADAQKNKNANSLLWKITKKENKEASYLFGTIHVICAQDYFWTGSMQKAMEETKQLCLEMNMDDPNLMTSAGMMLFDLSGTTLRDYFSNEADYQLVAHFIEDTLGQNMEMAQRMKPVALYMMYTMGVAQGPCKETVSYELKLVEKAKEQNDEVKGLETLAEQMAVLESIPTDSIIQQMIRIAKGEEENTDELEKLVSAYKKQDLTALNKLMSEMGNDGGMDGKKLIDDRNKKWIPSMEKMMTDKGTFFGVGAGHVPGLLTLLKSEGYTIEAVK
jgi:uncharacterized protein YbaP (TraB family)